MSSLPHTSRESKGERPLSPPSSQDATLSMHKALYEKIDTIFPHLRDKEIALFAVRIGLSFPQDDGSWAIPVESLSQMFGGIDYKNIMDKLLQEEIIVANDKSYQYFRNKEGVKIKKGRARTYFIPDAGGELMQVELTTRAAINELNKRRAETVCDEISRGLKRSSMRLPKKTIEKTEAFIETLGLDEVTKIYQKQICYDLYNGNILFKKCKNNRYYYPVTSLKKELRSFLFPEATQLDLVSSQITILSSLIFTHLPTTIGSKNSKTEVEKELNRWRNWVKSDIYTQIGEEYLEKDSITKEERTQMKEEIMRYLFSWQTSRFEEGKRVEGIGSMMNTIFPIIHGYLRKEKLKGGRTILHSVLTRAESAVIKTILKKLWAKDIPAISVHDEIIVPAKYKDIPSVFLDEYNKKANLSFPLQFSIVESVDPDEMEYIDVDWNDIP